MAKKQTRTTEQKAAKALETGEPVKTSKAKARTSRGEDHAEAANTQAERVAAAIRRNEKDAAGRTEGRRVAARSEEQRANPKTPEQKFGPSAKSAAAKKLFDNADEAQARGLDENITVAQHEAQARRAATGF